MYPLRWTAAMLAAMAALPAAATALAPGSVDIISRPGGFGFAPERFVNDSSDPTPRALTADGRYFVFASNADGLSTADDDSVRNIFLRDRQTGQTILVSRADGVNGAPANGNSFSAEVLLTPGPTVSPDDDEVLVAFDSTAGNLTADPPGAAGDSQVFVRNVTLADTQLVSRGSGDFGPTGNDDSRSPSIGIAGAVNVIVAFESDATNLIGPGLDDNGDRDVFARNLLNGNVELVSACTVHPTVAGCTAGHSANGFSNSASVSSGSPGTNGFVAFQSGADNIFFFNATLPYVSGSQIYRRDLAADTTTLISRVNGAGNTAGNAQSLDPMVNADGTEVVFASASDNLTSTADANGLSDVFVRHVDGNVTELISRGDGTGPIGDSSSGDPSITPDGSDVAFHSFSTNLSPDDGPGNDVFLRNREGIPSTTLVSRGPGAGGVAADGGSVRPAVAEAGGSVVVAFATEADNLSDLDDNDFRSLLLRDVDAGTLEHLSRPTGTGTPFRTSDVESTLDHDSVSEDGRFVVFESTADGLSAEDDDRLRNIFVRDTLSGETILVSRATGAGPAANAISFGGAISADGTRVAFNSLASNLTGEATNGVVQVYVRDLESGETALASRASGAAGAPADKDARGPAISADGTKVAFQSEDSLDPGLPNTNELDAQVYLRDLGGGATTLVSRDANRAGDDAFDAAVDADGSRVAFVSGDDDLSDADADDTDDVFVRDLTAGETVLASLSAAGAAGDDDSFDPDISGDGQLVAFRSDATNLGDDGDDDGDVFVRTLGPVAGTELVSRASGAGDPGDGFSIGPSLAGDGSVVSFASSSTNLVGDDTNGISDIFIRRLGPDTTELVSRAGGPAGAVGNAFSSGSAMSGNGDCVVFGSNADNLMAGPPGTDFLLAYMRAIGPDCSPPAPDDGGNGNGGGDGDGDGNGNGTPGARVSASAFGMTRRRFRVGRRPTPVSAQRRRTPAGTTFSFRLSRDARVTIAFRRLLKGRRVGKRCRKPTARNRGRRRCTREKRAGRLRRAGAAGSNRVPFSGRLGSKKLRPGRYVAILTAVDSDDGRSAPRRVKFRVVRR